MKITQGVDYLLNLQLLFIWSTRRPWLKLFIDIRNFNLTWLLDHQLWAFKHLKQRGIKIVVQLSYDQYVALYALVIVLENLHGISIM